MFKKILLVLGIIVVLFAGVNTAAALNSAILDAISGLPLGDQIAFVAREVDRLKTKDELRDICDSVGELSKFPQPLPSDYNGPGGIIHNPLPQMVEYIGGNLEEWLGPTLIKQFQDYLVAKSDCDRLTAEFNRKYED